MKFLRRFALLITLVLFGGLLYLAVYAYQEGFTKSWRKRIIKEFAKHDLNISFDKLTIDPFQGLVANNVILHDHDTKQEVARVSKVQLDIDVAKFIRKERFLERVQLKSANLSLPYDRKDPTSKRLALEDLEATVVVPNGRIEIAHAKATFYGLQVSLTGTLLRPQDEGASFKWESEKLRAAYRRLESVAAHLEKVKTRGHHRPVLDMIVSGDLAKPETLRMVAQLEAAQIAYDSFLCRQLNGDAEITHEMVHLNHLALVDDANGRLDFTGQFPLDQSQPAAVSLESTMQVEALFRSVAPDLPFWSWLTLLEAPKLSLQGSIDQDQSFTWSEPPIDVVGHVDTGKFRLGEQEFTHLSGDFHLDGNQFLARNLHLRHEHGESKGKFMVSPETGWRYDLQLGMSPTLLRALSLTEKAEAFLSKWEFRPSSGIAVTLSGERPADDPSGWRHRGHAEFTGCRFQTAEIEDLAMDFDVSPQGHVFSDVSISLAPDPRREYSGGTLQAEKIEVALADRLTTLTNLRGTLDAGQVVRCFSPRIANRIDLYRFSQPAEIVIEKGTIDASGTTRTDLPVEVKSTGTLSVPLLGQHLPLDQPRFGLHFHKKNLVVRGDHAQLFDGSISGNVSLRDLRDQQDYDAVLTIDHVDFSKFAKIYFPDREADGHLTGNFVWKGQGTSIASMHGQGSAHLLNSKRLEVPVFGPLSKLMQLVIGKTNVSHEIIRDLGAAFEIDDSTLHLKAIHADLTHYRVDGKGTIHLPTEAVDMEVSLWNQSAPAVVLNVLYEIFGTYRCTGTLEDPEWQLVNRLSPKDILKVVDKLGDPNKEVRLDPSKLLDLAPKLTDLFKRNKKAEEER